MFDQPAGLLKRMTAAENVVNAFRSLAQAENYAEWKEKNPDAWNIVDSIEKLRKETRNEPK